jgi:hypothetical protein
VFVVLYQKNLVSKKENIEIPVVFSVPSVLNVHVFIQANETWELLRKILKLLTQGRQACPGRFACECFWQDCYKAKVTQACKNVLL